MGSMFDPRTGIAGQNCLIKKLEKHSQTNRRKIKNLSQGQVNITALLNSESMGKLNDNKLTLNHKYINEL